MNFDVLLIGTDVNAYYMARNFHEEYGIKSYVLGRVPMLFTSLSKIVDLTIVPDLLEPGIFIKTLKDMALKIGNKKIILIGCNDDYVLEIVKNKDELSKYYLFNYTDMDLFLKLANKEMFYESFKDSGIDFPKTCFYDVKKDLGKLEEVKGFEFPIIVKPSNVVEYHKCTFANQAKVYKLNSLEEIIRVIKEIKDAGYSDKLIIQEFIPGDDHMLFDCVFYCDRNKRAVLQSFGQIGLQEHTKTGIGNLTVLINGYNEFGGTREIQEKLKSFIEGIGFNGICEFDLKYDIRDKTFKVFEINPRQARSSYYLTKCGYNLAKYLVDDIVNGLKMEFKFIDNKVALSFVPDYVVRKYIANKKYKDEFFRLKRKGLYTNPLKYNKDMSFERRKWLFKRDINYIKKYYENTW